MINPIVQFNNFDNFIYGNKTLQRNQDIEEFLNDLAEFINLQENKKIIDASKIYKNHPTIRIGLRCAMFVLKKQGKI